MCDAQAVSAKGDQPELGARALTVLRFSVSKRRAFGDLDIDIGDPVWDILLALTLSHVRRRWVALSEIVRITALPELATRRHLAAMCEMQLAEQENWSAKDTLPRVRITRSGLNRVEALLALMPDFDQKTGSFAASSAPGIGV